MPASRTPSRCAWRCCKDKPRHRRAARDGGRALRRLEARARTRRRAAQRARGVADGVALRLGDGDDRRGLGRRAARSRCTTSGSRSTPAASSIPAIVKAQVESAAALGLSSALLEQVVYEDGVRQSQNFDTYPILRREHMPAVHVAIVESGAPMGGVGEPGLPGVPPAVVNAIAALTGQRIRSLPVAANKLSGA